MCKGDAAGVVALVVLSALTALPAGAAEITVEPRLSTGVSYYNLDLDGEVAVGALSIDDVSFTDLLLFVGGGTTISVDRFFFDFSGQYSFGGEENLNLDIDAGGNAVSLSQNVDFDRIEAAVAVGYRITDQFAGYIGYRYANVDADGSGSLGGISASFSTELEQRGPLIGASFVVPKTILNGALVINGAVTFLDGDLENQLDAPAPIGNVALDVDGDAVGINGGVSWATPLSEQLKLVIGGDVSKYSFKDDNDDTDFDELIARLRAEVRYSFDTAPFFGN